MQRAETQPAADPSTTVAGDPVPEDVLDSLEWPRAAAGFSRITAGWDNRIWRFDDAAGRHVLRLYRGAGPGNLASAEAETVAMDAARAAGLPVPVIEARGSFEGFPAFVIAWADGKTLADLVAAKPWRVLQVGRAMGRCQARIHAAAPPSGLRHWDAATVARWAPEEPLASAVIAAARFDTFCHLDYHPLNLLATDVEPVAVLDWTNAAVSDPGIDLACTLTTLTVVPVPPGGPPSLVVSAIRRLLARGWRQGYTAEHGSFPLTPLFHAFAVARYVREAESAVSEGRGWLNESHLAAFRAVRDERLRAAGL